MQYDPGVVLKESAEHRSRTGLWLGGAACRVKVSTRNRESVEHGQKVHPMLFVQASLSALPLSGG